MRSDVLFLCVANSARSQMAEGLARSLAPDGVGVHSAGTCPDRVHPDAIVAMREIGIDIRGHRSKGIHEIPMDRIAKVVTLCAEEECPPLPGEIERLHWPLPDPAADGGDREARRAAFAAVRDTLRAQITSVLGTA